MYNAFYMYSMRQKKLPINGPFSGATVPVRFSFTPLSRPVCFFPVLNPVFVPVQCRIPVPRLGANISWTAVRARERDTSVLCCSTSKARESDGSVHVFK